RGVGRTAGNGIVQVGQVEFALPIAVGVASHYVRHGENGRGRKDLHGYGQQAALAVTGGLGHVIGLAVFQGRAGRELHGATGVLVPRQVLAHNRNVRDFRGIVQAERLRGSGRGRDVGDDVHDYLRQGAFATVNG